MSNPNPPPVSPRWFLWAAGLALLAYAIFLGRHSTVAAGGSDSSGYLNSARLIASGERDVPLRAPAELGSREKLYPPHFQPLGFAVTNRGRYVPTYPTGLPLHFALAGKIFGWSLGPLLIGVLGAVAVAVLTFIVARQLDLDWPLAAAGAVILAASPALLFAAIQPLSDVPATAWCLAAVAAALHVRRRPLAAHPLAWTMVAGAALGIAVLVRPTNLLLLPALLILLGLEGRRWLALAAGGAPFALWLGWYNQVQYGGPLRTGYPALADTFALEHAAPTLRQVAIWLPSFLPAAVLVLPLAALGRATGRSRERIALAVWFAAITAIYLCYSVTKESWICLRFLLPAFPALVLFALLGARRLVAAREAWAARTTPALAAVLIIWAVAGSIREAKARGVFYVPGYEDAYTFACRDATAAFPPGTLVVCSQLSGALYYYTDFPTLRWDHVEPADFNSYAGRALQAGTAVRAMLYPQEEADALQQRCPGEWVKLGAHHGINFWELRSIARIGAAP